MTADGWTPGEMLAVAAASRIRDDDVVLVGIGLPQVAAALARRTHAPNARLLLEIGVFDPEPEGESMGIADPRMWTGSKAYGGMLEVLGYMLQGGRVTLGLLGALQVDGRGSINTSLVAEADGVRRRFRGSGGGNDVASTAGRVLIVMRHEPRKFKAAVDFVTSPGARVEAVVTDRAVLEIHPSGAVLAAVHPGEVVEKVVTDTPMPLSVPASGVAVSEAPERRQLDLIRDALDPRGWYTQ